VDRRSSFAGAACSAALALVVSLTALRCGGSGNGSPVDGGSTLTDAACDCGQSLGDGPLDAGADSADAFVPNDGPASMKGAIQKGPFILGSTVTLSTIDGAGVSTGQVFNTQTTSDLGDFAITFAYRGNVDMQAQGFYFDEVTGGLSTAPIVLRALYVVTNGGPQSAYVNVLTHLAHDRALALMGDAGMTLPAAEVQAESELVAALGIGGGFMPGGAAIASNELGGDNDQNAYLFGVSAVLMQAAREQAADAGSVDAVLQELLDQIAASLARSGQLSSTMVSQLRTAERDLDVDLSMDLLGQRLRNVGSSLAAADLNRAIDTDGDGFRNTVDTCPLVANTDQSQIPPGAVCRVARYTTFLPSPAQTIAPVLGDFLNTGRLGLLRADLIAGNVQDAGFYPGNGGSFSIPGVPVQIASAWSPAAGSDLNGDGKLDLLMRNQSAALSGNPNGWSAGDGTGRFGNPTVWLDPTTSPDGGPFQGGSLSAVTLGDFNGDKMPDAAWMSGDLVAVSLNATGGFQPASAIYVPGLAYSILDRWLFAFDTNGDKNVDLVAVSNHPLGGANYNPTTLTVLVGDGAGHFQLGQSLALGGPLNVPLFADVNGDGKPDFVGFSGSVIEVGLGDGAGGFGSMTDGGFAEGTLASTTTSLQLLISAPVAGNFTADGTSDLAVIVCPGALCSLEVLVSEGQVFAPPQVLRTVPMYLMNGQPFPTLRAGDLNGDGTDDITVVSEEPSGALTAQGVVMNVLR
jgi:hypothetical protein